MPSALRRGWAGESFRRRLVLLSSKVPLISCLSLLLFFAKEEIKNRSSPKLAEHSGRANGTPSRYGHSHCAGKPGLGRKQSPAPVINVCHALHVTGLIRTERTE